MTKIIFLAIFLIIAKPIIAQEATNSATKTEDIKGILRQIVSQDNPQSDNSDNTGSNQPRLPKAFFGSITKINAGEITLNSQNENRLIRTGEETTYVDSKRRPAKLTSFKVGQTVLAMGVVNTDLSMDCSRIVATDSQSVINTHQIVSGQIVDVSQSQNSTIFVLIPSKNKNNQYQIKIDSKTVLTDSKGKTIASTKNIVSGKKLIAIIKPDSQIAQTFYAVRLITLDPAANSPTPTSKP